MEPASFRVGSATIMHFGGHISDRAWLLSRGVATGPERTVVLDIPPQIPADAWNEVLKHFPRKQVRVVAPHVAPAEVPRMGRWLANRLGAPVLLSTGVPDRTGRLGWLRVEPAQQLGQAGEKAQPGRRWRRAVTFRS
ncbi:hypothetical protein [Amycolatopsis sp. FDAARGOS 1241]|uniref:hypothetical protein n=1 Tax=Amycolatopsis sp. FDAARGOS 1241 TaxID=2778070 RepID=UPI00194E587F|nr:hypothetical protein [Amycolatopsis sp. FDAARGOS 1241]QRP45974.1 hypothetical protein I6J71_44120 [Amycolatopsis sp. FDAARGOS 1241]